MQLKTEKSLNSEEMPVKSPSESCYEFQRKCHSRARESQR